MATQVAAACKNAGWVATDTVQHGHLWPGGLDLSNPQSNHPAATLSSMGIASQLLALHLRGLCDPRAVRYCELFRDRQWDNGFGSGTHPKLEAVRVKPGITLELCVALTLSGNMPCQQTRPDTCTDLQGGPSANTLQRSRF